MMLLPTTIARTEGFRYVARCELGEASGPSFDAALYALAETVERHFPERYQVTTDERGSDC